MDDVSKLWHSMSAEKALEVLLSDAKDGLSSEEAQKRLETYGPNSITPEKAKPSLQILLGQFRNVLIVILLIAISISSLLGELVDAIVIAVIVIVAAVTGFVQEYRAEKVFEALKKRLSSSATVIRDGGVKVLLPAVALVPGDIVQLESGARVPADIRLIQSVAMQVDESSLTGESVPVAKSVLPLPRDCPVEERTNMVFAGTTVSYGRGLGVVAETADSTEYGRIAEETLEVKQQESPLERQIASIGRAFGFIALVVVSTVGISEGVREALVGNLSISGLVDILLFGIALAVAAVPEALPAIVTATLAVGMRKLAKNNALVRRMSAVETLGCTEVICFDKTGTLTKGEMTVREIYADSKSFQVTGTGYAPAGSILFEGRTVEGLSASLSELARASLLCSDATVRGDAAGRWEVVGDPTEGALVTLARKMMGRDLPPAKVPRVAEIPFSSERKLMTTIYHSEEEGGGFVGYMKGAPESVLSHCASDFDEAQPGRLREEDRDVIHRKVEQLSSMGLRVLALASRRFESEPREWDPGIEADFAFLGLVGIEDPLRDGAAEAVERARMAGMKPVMITGDHLTTGVTVAKRAGILRSGDGVLTGAELQRLSDSELAERVEQIAVYARISPLDKLKIVGAWKARGHIVTMTGDGVNDAPALKRADIGVAMGISGTDVAKEAADIVLADDDFSSIVRAVELGRWIYDNIRKYLAYLLQSNLVEITVLALIALLMAPILGLPEGVLPLLPVQILYINLATDGLPALALGFSPVDSDLLRRPPRLSNEPIFTKDLIFFLISTLVIQVPMLLLGFANALPAGVGIARTRLFLMIIFMELTLALSCRSLSQSVFRVRPHALLIGSALWETFLIVMLIEIPQSREALRVVLPQPPDILWIIGGVLITLAGVETFKRVRSRGHTLAH